MRLEVGQFLGRAVRAYASAGITATEYSYAPGTVLPRHEHPYAYFSFPLTGAYEERSGSRVFHCSTDSAVFHSSGELHDDRFESGTRIFSIEIADSWLERMREDGACVGGRLQIRTRALIRAAMRLRRLISANEPSLLRIDAAAIEVLASLPARQTQARAPRWLFTAVDFLRATQPRRAPTAELAGIGRVHPVHFARTFRRVYGCTIDEYVRALRVERAMLLLRSGKPLGEIALAAGFADQSHFCRDFKRVAGVTPNEFRRIHRVSLVQDGARSPG